MSDLNFNPYDYLFNCIRVSFIGISLKNCAKVINSCYAVY